MKLSVLTLNVWGIPFVSSDRVRRIVAIGAELNTGRYDIVSLQEVWSQHDCQVLKQIAESTLPYSHYFFSGVMGAGLLVLSKYPIVSTFFHAWSVNGYFHRLHHADWFGGKGVGMCKILVGSEYVHFYNAHLHAEYNDENDDYKAHRVIQAFEAAQFIEATRSESVVQLLAGDLNTQPTDICFKLLLHTSGLRDCCLTDEIVTSDCKRNSYTSRKILAKNPHGVRIDHILIRTAPHIEASINEYMLALPERVPGCKFSYSDHEAVLANIIVTPKVATRSPKSSPAADFTTVDKSTQLLSPKETSTQLSVLNDAIAVCEHKLRDLRTDRFIYYTIAIIMILLLIAMAECTVPLGLKTIFQSLRFLLFAVALYCAFMGFIWNCMEFNSVLAGKMSMELTKNSVENF